MSLFGWRKFASSLGISFYEFSVEVVGVEAICTENLVVTAMMTPKLGSSTSS